MKDAKKFTENTVVRLKKSVSRQSGPRQKAYIVGWLSDVPGGVVLSEKIHGCKTWNVDDLEIVGDGSLKNL